MNSLDPTHRDRLPPRILIVEDEPLVTRALRRSLERWGYLVAAAATGAEALEQVDAWPPDAVVLDRNLPDVDGLTLVDAIHARTAPRRPPVLMVTGDVETPKTLNALVACSSKPYEVRDLVELLGAWTHRGGANHHGRPGAELTRLIDRARSG